RLVLTVRATRTPATPPAVDPPRPLRWRRPVDDLETLVVIPTRDERATIETVLRATRATVPHAHVLVIDDASRDGTAELAAAVRTELGGIDVIRRVGVTGLGSAYRAGFASGLAAGFDVIIEMDADLSHDPTDLPAL